jgi:outer membrane protein OmpA-like peptidoglycan-associated protein
MKKKIMCLLPLIAVVLSIMLTSCSGGAGVSSTVDPKVLEDANEVQKIYDALLKSMGEQATKIDEVTISIHNPADKGKTGPAHLYLIADMQNPEKPKQLLRQMFHGELGGWQPLQDVTVDVRGSDEEKASFRLEDELFDFKSDVSAKKLHGIILDAYERGNQNPEQYTYRYVSDVKITIEGYRISVKSKLAANDQVFSDYYSYDPSGNFKN